MSKLPMALLWFLLPLLQTPGIEMATQCHNGGTFDVVAWKCTCTPDFYGENCETSYGTSDPCVNPNIPEIVDSTGSHGPGNTRACTTAGGCVDFSRLSIGWYRLRSPAGGSLTSTCPDTTNACGSSAPYIVTNILQEAHANRQLFSAKLSQVVRSGPNCYDSGDSYPVRILSCGSFNLYFLGPTMSDRHHYCIGNKKPCADGLVSADGSGYEPCYNATCLPRVKPGAVALPVLQQVKINKNQKNYDSYFNCSFRDAFETNFTNGLLYRVIYRLKFHNSTRITIPECTADNLSVSSGGRTTVSCMHEKLLKAHSNIYGGTLECVLQSKCNSNTSNYISQELSSVPHRFEFLYSLVDPTTNATTSVMKPSEPIQMCINISKVPTASKSGLYFKITVRRQAITAADKIIIMVNSSSLGNETESSSPCTIAFPPMTIEATKVCTTLTLVNEDEDGLIVTGLDGSQLVPVVEVNISYSSEGKLGVYTGKNKWVKLQSRQLTVDLTPLSTEEERKDYLHVYYDPFFKPANSDSTYGSIFYGNRCRVLSLIRHTILPYEVQIKECATQSSGRSLVTELALRYEYHLIRIFSKGGSFNYTTTTLERSALPLTDTGVPWGVTIEKANNGVRIKLDLYGTIIYTWGFVTGSGTCVHTFVQNRQSMFEFDDTCASGSRLKMLGYDSLDAMIIPGFYDTPSRVDGIMYRPNFTSWKLSDTIALNSARDMFSSSFVADRVSESLLKPTGTLNLCSCFDEDVPDSYDLSKRCAIQYSSPTREDYSRKKRSNPDPIFLTQSIAQPPRKSAQSSSSVNITAEMAAQHCADYVQSVLGSKYTVVKECSVAKGIIGDLDFITKFKTVCVQYATQLNVFDYTESLFNSFAGQCITSLSQNVSVVQSSKASTLQQMLAETCPKDCSGNGICISGACRCNTGYSGEACGTPPPVNRQEASTKVPKNNGFGVFNFGVSNFGAKIEATVFVLTICSSLGMFIVLIR